MFSESNYEGESFSGLDAQNTEINGVEFLDCTFINCNFSNAVMNAVEFRESKFEDCDLSFISR